MLALDAVARVGVGARVGAGAPALLAVAHGTRTAAGQAQIRDLAARVAARRPGLVVRLAYVDVQRPTVPAAVSTVDGPVVAVPLLLTAGYHVRVDIPAGLDGSGAVTSRPLGPDPRLVDLLAYGVVAAGPADAVVLAAAGSSDPRARAEVDAVARTLGAHVGYAATSTPRVPDVVEALRAKGFRHVVIAAYLLAGGLFHRSLHRAGADAVTPPLATYPELPDLVLDRYDEAVSRRAAGTRA
jgi:sirohydrochlorin ferrochelatase